MILRGELLCSPSCMIIHTMRHGCTGHIIRVRPGSSPGSRHLPSSVNRRDLKRAFVFMPIHSTDFVYTYSCHFHLDKSSKRQRQTNNCYTWNINKLQGSNYSLSMAFFFIFPLLYFQMKRTQSKGKRKSCFVWDWR